MASARSLGTLTLDLILKLGGFKQGADQAARESDKLAKKMKGDANEISNAFKKAGATLGIAFGVQQVVSGLIEAGAAAIKFGEDINRAAIQTGASAESLSELSYAASLADIEFGDLSTGITKLQKAVSEADGGNKAAIESFELLGLRVSDLKNLSPDEQLEAVADALKAIPDDADRATRAIDIFGKSGANLLPLFEEGAAGIRSAREEAQRLGLTMSGEQAKAFDDAGDAITRMEKAWAGLSRTLMGKVAPSLEAVANRIANMATSEPDWVDKLMLLSNPAAFLGGSLLGDSAPAASTATAPLGSKDRGQALGRGPGLAAEVAKQNKIAADAEKERAAAAKAAAAEAKRIADEAARAAADRAKIEQQALDELAKKYQDTYERGAEVIESLKTPVEKQIDLYHASKAALEQWAETFPNLADQANAALSRLENQDLEDITVTVGHIEIPPAAKSEFDAFLDEAQRQSEGLIADALMHLDSDTILGDFAKLFQQIAAQALAADLAKKLFGGLDKIFGGGGTTWTEKIGSLFAGFKETGGFVPPGTFAIAGEAGPEIVMGGRTGQTVVPMTGAAARAPVVQHISVMTQGGNISRQTELQITAAAARGVKNADRRNN